MSQPPVVSNSSALIVLEQIGHLGFLHHLFTQIIVPPRSSLIDHGFRMDTALYDQVVAEAGESP